MIPKPSLGRTFTVAAWVLGAVAAVQAGLLCHALLNHSPAPPAHIDVDQLRAEVPPPAEPDEPLTGADPLGGDDPVEVTESGARPVPVRIPGEQSVPPVAEPLTPRQPAATIDPGATPRATFAQPRPTPVPLSVFTPKADPRVIELIEQGKLLRNAGDTAAALAKFREASAMDAGSPTSIAEMAFTFEKMGMPDKAAEQWRRIIAMGEGAGALYSAARAKLDMAVAGTMREVAPQPTATVPAGKVLALGAVRLVNDEDPAAARKFLMLAPILTRAGASVAVRDVRIHVNFYEKLGGGDIVRTAANIKTRWAEPPADWRSDGSETLEVAYDLPRQEGGEARQYHGYIIRVFYADQLQDTRSEPADLLKKFPASENASD